MRLVDDHGRLFGKLNVVDALVLVVLVLLIPLAYAAYVLFKPAPARLLALQPAVVTVGTAEVAVRGENLRPYLRIVVGDQGGRFLYADTNGGLLRLPTLAPGSYDVTLLDEAAELTRLPGGLTVEGPRQTAPSAEMRDMIALGRFAAAAAGRAAANLAAALQPLRGDASLPWGEVLGVQVPRASRAYFPSNVIPYADDRYAVRAVVRFHCTRPEGGIAFGECLVDKTPLVEGATVPLIIGGGGDSAYFRVEQLHPVYSATADLVIRAYAAPDEVPLLRAWRPIDAEFPAAAALAPRVVSTEVLGNAGEPAWVVALVRVRLPVVETARGLVHQGSIVRIGELFTLDQPTLIVRGRVISIGRAVPAEGTR